MTDLTLRLHYATQWGEDLCLERRLPAGPGCLGRTERLRMEYTGGGWWSVSLSETDAASALEYRYVCRGRDGLERREPAFREVKLGPGSFSVLDQWFAAELPEAAFLRQAFAGVIFRPRRLSTPAKPPKARGVVRLRLRAPRVMAGYQIGVSGHHPLLGEWNPARALLLSSEHYPIWETELPLAALPRSLEYKFGLWSESEQRWVHFEPGPPRRLEDLPRDRDTVIVNAEHFRHETLWKGAGVAIPVFALRSERGYGIGEFADLELLAAWAAGCGMSLVQVLPVNDTSSDFSWRNSYPYKAICTAALHPVYLNLDRLFAEYSLPLPPDYSRRRDELNRLPQVDYEAVMRGKLAYLRELYAAVGPETLDRAAFQVFWREQADWLGPYAAFCCLRDRYGTADFSRWEGYAAYPKRPIEAWFKPEARQYAEVMFHAFLQFHLAAQFHHAVAAGHALGVAFKGDLPIGVDRSSVEAWTEPELFHMDRQTGAPPDSFSALGQNWGFPTYNWPAMEAGGYAWWRRRFHRMSSCFDALRIDHILGFFRIWEIPGAYAEGILGHFNPALPLSRDEIREAGFTGDLDQAVRPAIAEGDLLSFFGEETARVARELLVRDSDGWYRFRPDRSQAEAQTHWLQQGGFDAATAARLSEGLKRLRFEVLLLEDPDQLGRFHPRIAVAETARFRSLSGPEQAVLRALHDDFFYRRHTRFWEEEAMKKLPALMDATQMLVCGEDLGMIPASVPVVLQRLGLLSLEVQSMPKRLGVKFGDPATYPYLSVCATSTHDTPTLRGLWEENLPLRQAYFTEVMGRAGEAPAECGADIVRFILEHNLKGASMWCVFPLQDWLALDAQLRHPVADAERINVPAIVPYYWRYRMHLSLEQLQRAGDFNATLSELIRHTGRRPAW